MKRTTSRAGFTLVELLVALGLTIFLLALFTSLMVAATGSINTSQGISAADEQVRNAVITLRSDLKNAFVAGDNGRIPISRLFTTSANIPTKGYFLIEENDRAIRQGLDANGIPVEIDTDDVLAMTVGNPAANKPGDFYYGRVPDGANGNGLSNIGEITDLGTYLDNTHNSPFSRFDAPRNGIFTSKYAEVIYFLRPQGRQYSINDLRGDIQNNPAAIPATPALYTLYRRQLLVIENAERMNIGSPLAPQGIRASDYPAFFDKFDISASRQFEIFTDPMTNVQSLSWLVGNPPQERIHFNSLADLSRREFRYGMRIFTFDTPFAAGPPTNFVSLHAMPLSHFVPQNWPAVHCYRDVNPTDGTPPQDDSAVVPWFGRPTQRESGSTAYGLGPPPVPGVAVSDLQPFASDPTLIDAYSGENGQRRGDDVLLTNVVSFDVKVLEDFKCQPWVTDARLHAAAASAINPLDDFLIADRSLSPINYIDLTVANPPALNAADADRNSRFRRPEFVDLGFGHDRANAASYATTIYPGNNDNCTPLASYFYHPEFAPFGALVDPANEEADAAVATARIRFGPNNHQGDGDDLNAASITLVNNLRGFMLGAGRHPGRSGFDDDGDGDPDNPEEYLYPNSDDTAPWFQAPYSRAGQAGDPTGTVPWRFINPRNTYDSWSRDYRANPRTNVVEGVATPPIDHPQFRPVPYPRPLKGIQIKLRVLEPKSGIVREFTIRHFFDE